MKKGKTLSKYLKLAQTHPVLFSNQEAMYQIVTDPQRIAEWEQEKRDMLREKGLPEEWASIGILVDDPYILVLRDLVFLSNAPERPFGYTRIIAQAYLEQGVGVAVLPIYQNKIVVLKQYRHATRNWHYECPRGFGEPHLSSEANAAKEVKEEIGANILRLKSLGKYYSNTGLEAQPVHLYWAEVDEPRAGNEREGITQFLFLSVSEFEQWILEGKINDGFTIATYTRAKLASLLD